MRHRKAGFKLGRDPEHRLALWRNLAISVLTHGQIETTRAKARSVQPMVEKLITAAKRGDLAARRRVIQQIGDPFHVPHEEDPDLERTKYGELVDAPRVVKRLFDEIAPRFQDRDGGYTRIIKLGRHRVGDGGDLCMLQLVGEGEEGPQVSGRYSRRREKAHRRAHFAAQRRKRARQEASAGGEQPAQAQTADSDPEAAGETGGQEGQ